MRLFLLYECHLLSQVCQTVVSFIFNFSLGICEFYVSSMGQFLLQILLRIYEFLPRIWSGKFEIGQGNVREFWSSILVATLIGHTGVESL
eukprot:UN23928